MISSYIDTLLIGGPKPFRADGTQSAMAREAVSAPVMLRRHGFDGDQVADPSVHGGADKAVHLYPTEHYPCWTAKLDGHRLLQAAGAFGENISASGFTESRVKIGDRFHIGAALVEVAQGRQPCWKIDHHFGLHGLSREIIRTGRCGLYFRVIEEGFVAPGDTMQQAEAAPHDWTIARTFKLLVAGGHRAAGAADELRQLAKLETLAEVWRKRAAALAGER
ncbi:MOSC domain-containing protein [Sphingorhabdus arenilitoris]|uniref:MOSC domain-containing protein n=1 Tax=Sphingorhabdus arenilitoris TaxID=1490041 RepID=A0ABV8RJ99_9SPHN